MADFVNALTGYDTPHPPLDDECGLSLDLVLALLLDEPLLDLLEHLPLLLLLSLRVHYEQHTPSALTTTLIFLDETDGIMDVVNLHGERLSHDLLHRCKSQMSIFNRLVYGSELILEVLDGLLGLLIIIGLLLLLLFLALLNLLSLLAALLLHGLTELDVYGDLVELTEVTRNWYLDDRWIILQVKQKLIQVYVHACRPRVEKH